MPDSTVVAGPVRAASAISRTGEYSVPVKYSVRRLTIWARTSPTTTAAKTLRSSWWPDLFFTYPKATAAVPTTVRTPAGREARVIGLGGVGSGFRALAAQNPTVEGGRA